MSTMDVANATGNDWAQGEQDLGPLAWVLGELRKSLEGAVKAMRRFVRDAEIARQSDIASLDAGALRIARQQLHQAGGALEMVGMRPPALVVRALEAAVQRFVQRPESCDDEAAAVIERASFALVEYLEHVLAGKAVSPVALFPQYRQAQALAGAERVHPADLWPTERRFREPDLPLTARPLDYGSQARARLDHAVLRVVKSDDRQAAGELQTVCLGLAAAQAERQPRAFWKLCAGFFEALACGALQPDVYVKRVASRVLMQYASLARGDAAISDRLVQDLLFFCAQAAPAQGVAAPALAAVRQAYGLARHRPVDYERPRFGLYDPAVLAQARKRIAAATETWSALAGGDRSKLKAAADQFSLVCDSLRKLQPGSESMAQALMQAVDAAVQTGEPPNASLAIEVATAVLYLQASFEDIDVEREQVAERADNLARRVADVAAGGEPRPLEPWMEDLYRRVSDNQTMGSVVGELRASLAEAEKAMDQYFRDPQDTAALANVPGGLQQMRGVLSVLGLDQASLAVMHMRGTVERLMTGEVLQAERAQVFEKLGNSLGALSLLIDMLSYQRAMARKLFVYDEEQGELRVLMGRARPRAADDVQQVEAALRERGAGEGSEPDAPPAAEHAPTPPSSAAASEEPQALPAEAGVPAAAASAPPQDDADDDAELLDIFLEEAREVVAAGLSAIGTLQAQPGDLSEQTTLRRAFHTLKGSSRMVGLNEFGEAAWSLEQALNAWLAEQKPIPAALLELSGQALQAFGRWADDISHGQPHAWQAQPFRAAADAMRLEGVALPLSTPDGAPALQPDALAGGSDGADSAGVAQPADQQPLPEMAAGLQAPPDLDGQEQPGPGFAADAEEALPPGQAAAPHGPQAEAGEEPPASGAAGLADDDEEPQQDFADTSIDLMLDAPASQGLELGAEIDFAYFEQALEETRPAEGKLEPLPEQASQPDGREDAPDIFFLPAQDAGAALALETDEGLAEPQEAPPAPAGEELELPPHGYEVAPLSEAALPADEPADKAADEAADESTADEAVAVEAVIDEAVLDEAVAEEPVTGEPGAEEAVADEAVAGEAVADEAMADEAVAEEPLYGAPDAEEAVAGEAMAEEAQAVREPLAHALPELPLDEVKVIGSLRIGIPLYNVYLNEADEWSRRLATSLQEWALELHRPVPEVAVALAHSLAGSSATVGFSALSELARALEHALQHLQLLPHGMPAHAQAVNAAASEVRRLLHQFAAGFLKEPSTQVLAQLRELLDADVVSARSPLDGARDAVAAPAAWQPAAVAADGHEAGGFARHDQEVDAARALALAAAQDIDDDIDVLDIIDPDLFPIFEEEAAELLPRLGGALRQWAARPDNLEARSELLRALHTLKGSARLAGAMRLGEMAHRMEGAVEHIALERARSADIEPLLARLDALQADFDALRTIGAQPLTEAVAVPAAAVRPAGDAQQQQPDAPVDAAGQRQPAAPATPLPAAPVQPALRSASGQSVRVRARLLDRLVNQAGEVMIARSRLEAHLGQLRGSLTDLSGNLERLRLQLRDIEVQAESQMQSRLALSRDSAAGFDPLEFDRFTRVQELTRMMAESVNDVATVQRNMQRAMDGAEDDLIAQGRQARELQRDLLRTRMVEFEGISERLYAVVRQAAKETGKQIKLDIAGGAIEMDRGVLDRMTPVFEHLLRNCVGHGIEPPEERLAAGKSATGAITIALRQEGNDVAVEFRDDGAGLDLERIRARALATGLVPADAQLDDAQAAQLIFQPGFSTASEVTELSGRGIGMDVVRSEVSALGGRVETRTERGHGTAFRLVLPLTTAVTQVVMLRAGALVFGVPAALIEIVRRASAAQVEAAYAAHAFEHDGQPLPFHWAGALLQASARSAEAAGKSRPVLVVRSAAQRLAMHVDEVLGNQEVVVKNLGPQLSRLPGLAGMSVLASGAVVLIYNPVALATVYGEQLQAGVLAPLPAQAQQPDSQGASALPPAAAAAQAPQVPLVLVVDDSITVRRVTQRLLVREGYRVALAADGLQALERLQEERPAVVLSDIEMPRMDGFDLARNIRADAALRELPIIMITSRIAQKHREHALQLGVNHYLGKPYSDEELLSLVQHYTRQVAAVQVD